MKCRLDAGLVVSERLGLSDAEIIAAHSGISDLVSLIGSNSLQSQKEVSKSLRNWKARLNRVGSLITRVNSLINDISLVTTLAAPTN